ncbi:MAG: hypothetical protein ABR579_08370, partial [Actinomycetota bacterium]
AVSPAAGDYISSARLLGVAGGLRESLGAERTGFEQELMKPYEDATQEGLGEASFVREFGKGQQMLLRDTVQLALDVGSDIAASTVQPPNVVADL